MSKSYLIKPPLSIFKEYDVRSKVGEDLNENTYYTLGVAIGSELQEVHGLHTLLLSRDSRASSDAFAESLIKGLLESGTQVIDIGCLPTPIMHFAMYDLQCHSGLMVTASHNPADYNGLKLTLGDQNYYGDRLYALYQRIMDEKFLIDREGRGKLVQYPSEQIINKYIRLVKERTGNIKKLRIVVDCGNAVAGHVAPQLLSALGCEVIPLYCDVQSSFPNHHPDPSVEENLTSLCRMVVEQHADLGVAFDGDGDRLGIVDNQGCIIPSDYLLLAFADALLKKEPNTGVVFDIKCTQHLTEHLLANQGRPIMTRTGMAHIMSSMSEHTAAIGGEYCGHFYFHDRWLEYDDGIYAAARALEMLSEQQEDSHNFFEKFPKSLSTSELKIDIEEQHKDEFMKQLITHAPMYIGGELVQIDGLRVKHADAWGLVRPSNTGPYLTLRFEATTYSALQNIKDLFGKLITTINPSLVLPF